MSMPNKRLNETNKRFGDKNKDFHIWKIKQEQLFGSSQRKGIVEYFENGDYNTVIDFARISVSKFKDTELLNTMDESDLMNFYYLGESYLSIGQIHEAVGCFHIVYSQKGFKQYMSIKPIGFSEFVDKAENRLLEIAVEKGEEYINDYDVNSFFANSIGKKSGCFIATAAFDSPLAPEVIVLRNFRDNTLNKTSIGRTMVKIYYIISPRIASTISSSDRLKILLRQCLMRFVSYLIKNGV